MKKIVLDKEADIADAIDRVLGEPDTSVILVVPRGSVLGKSVRNFHLLKREMDSTGRQLEIESVDEQILAFAKEAKIPGRHPLFTRASNGGSVSDIVAMKEESVVLTVEDDGVRGSKKKSAKGKVAKEEPVPLKIEVDEEEVAVADDDEIPEDDEPNDADEEEAEENRAQRAFLGGGFFKNRDASDDDDGDDDMAPRRSTPWKGIGIALGVVIVAVLAFFVVTKVFGHANVTINFVKTPWQSQVSLTGDKSVAAINPATTIIPAQVFFQTKNVTQQFPASGSANVSLKAHGTITIYNAYSSAAQTLVATTRFQAPDGKIFRLTEQVVVPGAVVANGQITPSSITANVIADQPGPDYNVGAIDKLTIPGFANGPKFNGFYGALPSGTSGGFTGQRAVPTAADITAAKASTTAILQSALKSAASFDIPANFKILDVATTVQISKLAVNTSTDANGNFSVFGQVAFQAIGFDESMLKSYFLARAQSIEPSSTFTAFSLNYSNVVPDFTNGRIGFSVNATGTLEPAFSADTWKVGIAGDTIQQAQAEISSLPNLQDGKISVWPVWLWNIPADPAKINVTVD